MREALNNERHADEVYNENNEEGQERDLYVSILCFARRCYSVNSDC